MSSKSNNLSKSLVIKEVVVRFESSGLDVAIALSAFRLATRTTQGCLLPNTALGMQGKPKLLKTPRVRRRTYETFYMINYRRLDCIVRGVFHSSLTRRGREHLTHKTQTKMVCARRHQGLVVRPCAHRRLASYLRSVASTSASKPRCQFASVDRTSASMHERIQGHQADSSWVVNTIKRAVFVSPGTGEPEDMEKAVSRRSCPLLITPIEVPRWRPANSRRCESPTAVG
jgi:hypothetical protein